MPNAKKRNKKLLALLIACLCLSFAPSISIGAATPTDIYYTVKSIDDSLEAMYLTGMRFEKERLSEELTPTHVIRKAQALVTEFMLLDLGTVDAEQMERAYDFDPANVTPDDTMKVLDLIKEALEQEDLFEEHFGLRQGKSPSDVFQMMRQLSYRCLAIAKMRNIQVDRGTPGPSYDNIIHQVFPNVIRLAKEQNIEYTPFLFPNIPLENVKPAHVYSLLQATYANIAAYLNSTKGYEPITFNTVWRRDQITPFEVLDTAMIFVGEMNAQVGEQVLDVGNEEKYAQWRDAREKVTPGDLIQLVQHLFIVSRSLAESVQ